MTADRRDALGCLVWELSVVATTPRPQGATLTEWAQGIAGRVQCLTEPLKVVEIDLAGNQAQLRSQKPQNTQTTPYFEIVLQGNRQAMVRRYEAGSIGHPRDQVTFAMTYDALAQLICELTAR